MNYRHIYMRIISHARQEMELGLRPKTRWQNYKFPNQYFEFHHILPKCEFPLWENRKSNGLINIQLKEGDEVPEGFWRGRTLSEKAKESAKAAGLKRVGRSPKNKGLKCFNTGKVQVYRDKCPEGFVKKG